MKLHKIDPGYIDPDVTEKDALAQTKKLCKKLRKLQAALYGEKQRSVLIVLQAMDAVSLAACCTKPPSRQTQDLMPQPGAAPIRLNLARQGKDVIVDPWPFQPAQVDLMIPVCRIEKRAYESDDELRVAANGGSAEVLTCRVLPAH